jgi:hypothetical protein
VVEHRGYLKLAAVPQDPQQEAAAPVNLMPAQPIEIPLPQNRPPLR